MLDELRKTLIRECKLEPKKPVLVGFSGGPDSLCLLDVLHQLGYQVIAAHLNHKLRPDSTVEAEQVKIIAGTMGIPIFQSAVDVTEFAHKHAFSIEEAARVVRYDFLFNVAVSENVQAVAVGHNADDQVETVLMHFVRGAGLAGLRGMAYRTLPNAWSEWIPLIRPLLGVWREEILRYCHKRDLHPITDESNLDKTFFRNRLRHELIPYLEGYNPKIKDIIHRTADILSEDFQIISEKIDLAWDKCSFTQGPGYLALKIDCLREQRLSVVRHIIRKAIAYHCPDLRDIDFKLVESVISFLEEPPKSNQRDLASGLRLLIENNLLWIAEWGARLPEGGWPAVPEARAVSVPIPGKIFLAKGWELSAGILPATNAVREQALANKDPYQAWLDAGGLPPSLQIRSRLPGDRFSPLGLQGHSIKLSDFMINVKMHSRARENWPLICSNDTIIWVPGYRIHHACRLKENTNKVLHLTLRLESTSKSKDDYE